MKISDRSAVWKSIFAAEYVAELKRLHECIIAKEAATKFDIARCYKRSLIEHAIATANEAEEAIMEFENDKKENS